MHRMTVLNCVLTVLFAGSLLWISCLTGLEALAVRTTSDALHVCSYPQLIECMRVLSSML